MYYRPTVSEALFVVCLFVVGCFGIQNIEILCPKTYKILQHVQCVFIYDVIIQLCYK